MKIINELIHEAEKTQVIMLAGGKAKRMGLTNVSKALIKVAGKTLLEREIELYRNCGFKKYKLLIGHLGKEIMEYAGNGEKWNVEIKYSMDPNIENIGKGKALKQALLNGVIERDKRAIITFPDDLKFNRFLPLILLAQHIYGVENYEIWATSTLVTSTTYPYGVAEVDEVGRIIRFAEKPLIKVLTHIGVCIIEKQVYKLIEELIDINSPEAQEYENIVLPKLAEKGKLYSLILYANDKNDWIPINTLKELEFAEKVLKVKGLGSENIH
ncbi:MAG: sugar phosphate nucleotidyltransferase [Candidatus Methanomethylicia archaeon]|nr:sugar phosphate nucleotidyltransferase [Candidatus Methanomethylicia archaeon]MCX8169021.1 sugar phosphate nucleotidyltransferase [Candidatus Methanomethylicia archaeon]MDW7988753.1 sugar phosphate nucleotidyltransferase [Nitrososphaerota archaeon]